jgi:hypothetical protein
MIQGDKCIQKISAFWGATPVVLSVIDYRCFSLIIVELISEPHYELAVYPICSVYTQATSLSRTIHDHKNKN